MHGNGQTTNGPYSGNELTQFGLTNKAFLTKVSYTFLVYIFREFHNVTLDSVL